MVRWLVLIAVVFSGASLMASEAGAFCLENNADARLLFAAKPERSESPEWTFFGWLKPGQKSCGKPDSGTAPVEVFVFVDEDALEGCDARVAPTGTLKLKSFAEFDNCAWAE